MVIQEAIKLFKEHQKGAVKKSSLKSDGKFLDRFLERFSDCEIISVSADQIGKFLEETTEGLSRSTRHLSGTLRSRRFYRRRSISPYHRLSKLYWLSKTPLHSDNL